MRLRTTIGIAQYNLFPQARFSATPLDLLHPSLASSVVSSISPLISSVGVFELSFSSSSSSSSDRRLVVKVDSESGVTSVGGVFSAPSAAALIGDSHVLVRIDVDKEKGWLLTFRVITAWGLNLLIFSSY